LFKEDVGCKSKMLVKLPEFRVVLVTMRTGMRWEKHKTNSRILVQTLLGHIQFHTPNGTFDLRVGQLLTVDPDVVHSVDSPEESAFLLTLFSPHSNKKRIYPSELIADYAALAGFI
jgi:quercetin dioxygenase-like cupin family protein